MTYWIYIADYVEDSEGDSENTGNEEMDNSYDQGMVYIDSDFDLLAEAGKAKGGTKHEEGLLEQDSGGAGGRTGPHDPGVKTGR